MKLRDIENAIHSVVEENDLYEVTLYLSKAECLWLIAVSERCKDTPETIIGQIISDRINP